MWSKKDMVRESRWGRHYTSPDGTHSYFESRFMDGSASITFAELKATWDQWPDAEKWDFCHGLSWVKTPERPDMVRFLVENGDHGVWSAIALLVASDLRPEESLPILQGWCQTGAHTTNYYQAIAHTGSAEAHDILKGRLWRILETPGFMEEHEFLNEIASDAVFCLQHLMELGEDPEPFRAAYETLKNHPCEGIRESTERWLEKYFAPGGVARYRKQKGHFDTSALRFVELGKTYSILVVFSDAAPDESISLELPDGIELVDGESVQAVPQPSDETPSVARWKVRA